MRNKKLSIRFEKHPSPTKDLYYINVNGIADHESHCWDYSKDEKHLNVKNKATFNILIQHSFAEIKNFFSLIIYNQLKLKIRNEFTVLEILTKTSQSAALIIYFQFDLENWTRKWSLKDFSLIWRNKIKNLNNQYLSYYQNVETLLLDGFGVKYKITDENFIVEEEINNLVSIFNDLYKDTYHEIVSNLEQDSLISIYEFPSEIKSICKQYLIYFTQFLADLGIYAETEIKEEANKTLFKITPKDKSEALENIKKILDTYLQMAGSSSIELMNMDDSNIAVQQLKANIHHLQGQLYLSKSVMQMKDATIEALQLSNFQLKEKVTILDKEKSKKEDIIPGALSVKEYDGKGFSIDIPNIVRNLKRRFTKDK
jgi:hypothetical protein